MRILYYAKEMTTPARKLKSVFKTVSVAAEVETSSSVLELAESMLKFNDELTVVVTFAARREELLELFSISRLLGKHRFILILPDRDNDTLRIGYLLEPRYISYADGDFLDTQAVIQKMGQNIARRYETIGLGRNAAHSREIAMRNQIDDYGATDDTERTESARHGAAAQACR